MNGDMLWRPQFIEGLWKTQPAPTLTVAVDAARCAPSFPSHAHNGRFKDKNGVAPDAMGTKGRGAKNTPTVR
jgi:hypothetical protein